MHQLIAMLLLSCCQGKPPDALWWHVQIEATPVLPRARNSAARQEQQKPLAYKVGRLLALSLLATMGRRTPILRWIIAPVVSWSLDGDLLPQGDGGLQPSAWWSPRAGGGATTTGSILCFSSVYGHKLLRKETRHAPDNTDGASRNPQMLFKSGERLLGTERAVALAALGAVPAVAPWALDFLQLWRSRRAAFS